jgi:hypothetical protein
MMHTLLNVLLVNAVCLFVLIHCVIDLSLSLDVTAELDRLQSPNVKGLGGAQHRHLVDIYYLIYIF